MTNQKSFISYIPDVYWQKRISFGCDVMVLLGCVLLFYGLTVVSRTKNECRNEKNLSLYLTFLSRP